MSIHFKKDDFKELVFSYIFVNQTSGTECRNYEIIQANDFAEEGIKITAPKTSCAVGHNLMLLIFEGQHPNIPKIIPKDGDIKGIFMVVIGKVEGKEDLANKDMCMIDFKFNQFDIELWEEIRKKYIEQQLKIDGLLDKIKINED